MRISFTGDIMCELATLRKSKIKNQYNFDGILSRSDIFGKTDYLVGNLETVLAGKNAKYSKDIYSYNTPDSFADELSKAGFNLVSTANNHCLDRGKFGLLRTMEVLDEKNINYIGTNIDKNDKRYRIVDLENIKVGFLAYTYGSNYSINKNKLEENDKYLVNFFEKQEWIDNSRKDNYSKLKEKILSAENRVKLMKVFKKEYNRPRIDNNNIGNLDKNLIEDISFLKSKVDYIILLMHSGGQFNIKPGIYTRELVKKLKELGVDLVIGHHPHVVQECKIYKDFFVAYSLGNFFMSPDTIYLINENLPMYSIVLHLDIISNIDYQLSFSIAKIVKTNGYEKVVNVYDLLKYENTNKDKLLKDCEKIYKIFTGIKSVNFDIKKEYKLMMEK